MKHFPSNGFLFRAELALPYFLTLLAEAYREIGRIEEGLTTVAQGLIIAPRNNERWYEAELYRLRSELLLDSGRNDSKSACDDLQSQVEVCFQKAINIAHDRKAKSLLDPGLHALQRRSLPREDW
ncbi:MAG: hypothetical protein AB7G75_26305 [Candidatus Binatia bacterium]